jgi:hypothetical protein
MAIGLHGRFRATTSWADRKTLSANVNRSLRELQSKVREQEWLGEIAANGGAFPHSARAGSVRVIADTMLQLGPADAAAREAMREIEAIPGAGRGADVLVFLRRMPENSMARQSQWMYGSAPLGTSWNPCVIANGGYQNTNEARHRGFPAVLGQCALAAAYGAPGRAVRGWQSSVGLLTGQPLFAPGYYLTVTKLLAAR